VQRHQNRSMPLALWYENFEQTSDAEVCDFARTGSAQASRPDTYRMRSGKEPYQRRPSVDSSRRWHIRSQAHPRL